ncbi:hypothetical protein [uncultured Desulfovibrio sp.]|jgi:hypothetical protein|uniref:hypothetical protein n=1 Tax=uncultured Desulfovibrio sp. TaxID=167968 RepID=UPI00280390C9|nr:hypothetical protein [uncultured Desulfovibrio sp.]
MADVDTAAGTETGTTAETETTTATDASTQAPGTLLTDKPGEGGNGQQEAGKPDGADGKGEAGKEGAEAAAYTLTAPEGYPISEGALKGLNEVCKSANLNEEQANAVMAYMQGNYTSFVAAQQEAMQAQAKTWIGEFQADKEFGGDKFDASVADAQRALATFDQSGTVSKMLAETGYGNNPDVLRIFARVGRALGEDKLIGNGSGGESVPLEDRLFK